MSAVLSQALQWRMATVADVPALLGIEQSIYSHPWTLGNFIDSLAAGHWIWLAQRQDQLISYWLAQPVLDEVHVLNLAVHGEHWGQGYGASALAHLHTQARQHGSRTVWLEVRLSNVRAQALYQRACYQQIGQRKAYYPAGHQQREDALVYRLDLPGAESP